jgi:D-erythronate 2-dehydrogenase
VANVLVTGGSGFLGARLARHLLSAGPRPVAGSSPQPVSAVTLADRVPAPPDLAGDERVTVLNGDLGDLLAAGAGRDALAAADVVFHLAAAVSAECEADFDLGIRANLRATEGLLASCRAAGTSPVVVFASSLAVFGASREHPLPAVVDDQVMPNPQSSYGTQKVIAEQLLADYTRKGFLRGRAVRLMTVSVRPGRPNAAASGFLSAIIREPLGGQRATCSVAYALASAAHPPRDLPGRPADRGGARLPGPRRRRTAVRRCRFRPGLGRPDPRQPAGPDRDRGADDRSARAGRGTAGRRADRLGARPGRGGDRDGLAGPVPGRPGGPARPRPGPRL